MYFLYSSLLAFCLSRPKAVAFCNLVLYQVVFCLEVADLVNLFIILLTLLKNECIYFYCSSLLFRLYGLLGAYFISEI